MGYGVIVESLNITRPLPTWNQKQRSVELFYSESSKRKLLFGCTSIASEIALRVQIDGFVDDKFASPTYCGFPVFKSGELNNNDLVISTITGVKPVSVAKHLARLKIESVDYFAFKKLSPIKLPEIPFWTDPEIDLLHNSNTYLEIYDSLSDNESRLTFRRIVQFRNSSDLNEMFDFHDQQDMQYFEKCLQLQNSSHVFVDVGAYDGFTSHLFSKLSPNYSEIHAFEPIPSAFEETRNRLNKTRNCHTYNFGASDRTHTVYFTDNGSASVLDAQGDVPVQLHALDEVLKTNPTIIKMDIEGGEIPALQGLEHTRRHHRPVLAIACYHYPSQMRAIYEECRRIEQQFDLYLRHYTEGTTETVLFVVPR